MFALLVIAGGLAYYWHKLNSLDRVDVSLAAAAANQPENFLLVGSDTRDIAKDTPDAGGIFGKGNSEEYSGQRRRHDRDRPRRSEEDEHRAPLDPA